MIRSARPPERMRLEMERCFAGHRVMFLPHGSKVACVVAPFAPYGVIGAVRGFSAVKEALAVERATRRGGPSPFQGVGVASVGAVRKPRKRAARKVKP